MKFLQDYFYYCTVSGNTFNEELGKKLFNKLPGALGREIEERWYKRDGVVASPNVKWTIGHRTQHIMDILIEKCTNIQIQKQLKRNEMNFCKFVIYTTQNYDNQKKPKRYKRKYNQKPFSRKQYF